MGIVHYSCADIVTESGNQVMLDRKFAAVVAALILLIGQNAFADTADAWAAGQLAFHDGDYASALGYFQSARDAGLDGPAVHYNIAVCHFKLRDYDQARQVFYLIAEKFPQMRGLAEYNLGLVARRLGDERKARQHFLSAYQLSPDNETLRILASNMLGETEPAVSTVSRWVGSAGLRAGHDSNVALRDEIGLPAGATASTPMADVFGSIRSPSNGRNGFRLDASAYLARYFDSDEFDQSDVYGKIFYDLRLGDWRFEFGGHGSAGTLGGKAFDRKAGGGGRAVWYLGRTSSIDFRYTYDDIRAADSAFAGIKGSRQQVEARYQQYSGGHRLILKFSVEANDRVDPGVSPARTILGAEYRYEPGPGWGYEAALNFRDSDYDDLATPRKEELLSIRAGLTHMLFSDWFMLFDYRYSENDSSDPSFSYDRNQISLGILKTF